MTDDDQLRPTPPSSPPTLDPQADFDTNLAPQDSSKVMKYAMGLIVVAVAAAAVVAITPVVRDASSRKERIKTLEMELAQAKRAASAQNPSGGTLDEVQRRIAEFTEETRSLRAQFDPSQIQGQLADMQGRIGQIARQSQSLGLSSMMAKVQALQASPQGDGLLSKIVLQVAAAPAEQDVGEALNTLRATDPDTAALTEGVSPDDMKAAAMLMAMAQMRHSLARNNDSFDTDLALLKRSVPSGNPKLMEAIDRLAPQARYGVLTPEGLSTQLRGMTGDIVQASLNGEDISFKDKAKARMSDLFLLEKNGQRVSGTDTQLAVAAAQKELDRGNVAEATKILQTLQGPAAEKSKPLIEQAQATIAAGNLQNMLNVDVMQTIRDSIGGMVNGIGGQGGNPDVLVNPNGIPQMTEKLKSMLPQQLTPAAPVAPVQ